MLLSYPAGHQGNLKKQWHVNDKVNRNTKSDWALVFGMLHTYRNPFPFPVMICWLRHFKIKEKKKKR